MFQLDKVIWEKEIGNDLFTLLYPFFSQTPDHHRITNTAIPAIVETNYTVIDAYFGNSTVGYRRNLPLYYQVTPYIEHSGYS